jgi:hypothetical protein
MICSSECLLRFIVWSFLIDQTPIRPGSIQGGNVTDRLSDSGENQTTTFNEAELRQLQTKIVLVVYVQKLYRLLAVE